MASHVTSPRASHQHHRHLFSLKNNTTSSIRFRDRDKKNTTQSVNGLTHPNWYFTPSTTLQVDSEFPHWSLR